MIMDVKVIKHKNEKYIGECLSGTDPDWYCYEEEARDLDCEYDWSKTDLPKDEQYVRQKAKFIFQY